MSAGKVDVLAVMEAERQAADQHRYTEPKLAAEDYMAARSDAAQAQDIVRELIAAARAANVALHFSGKAAQGRALHADARRQIAAVLARVQP